jgi:hypothetical protein
MATAPDQIRLGPDLQRELAQLADDAGKPWNVVLSEALASYRAERVATSSGESVHDAMQRLGLLGCVDDAPADLSTNSSYMNGFGRDDA